MEYLECDLPVFLQNSIRQMQESWTRLDAGQKDNLWDCNWCELQSDINVCEVEQLITQQQARYLREKYLRMEISDD